VRLLLLIVVSGFAATAAIAQTSPAPNAAEAQSVCRAIAEGRAEEIDVQFGYRGDDPEDVRWTSVDVDNDGRPEDVRIATDGTSNTPSIVQRGERFPDRFYSRFETHEPGRSYYAPWAGRLRLVRHEGRVYEVFYYDTVTLDYPVYAAIHLPGYHQGRWVCAFQSDAPLPRLTPVAGREDAAPVCRAVEERRTSDAPDFPMTASSSQGRARASVVRAQTNIDFMNDGREQRLNYLEWVWSGGAGCSFHFYDIADAQAPGAEAEVLTRLQSDEVDSHSPVRIGRTAPCRGMVTRFLDVDGSVVLEQRFPGERPQRFNQAFWRVSRVENGRAVRLCEATGFAATPRTIRFNPEFYPQAD
jgi:hypothetical protein